MASSAPADARDIQAEEEVPRSEEDEAASGNEAADVDAVDGGAAAPSPEGVAADGDATGAADVAAGGAHGPADGGFGPAPAGAAVLGAAPINGRGVAVPMMDLNALKEQRASLKHQLKVCSKTLKAQAWAPGFMSLETQRQSPAFACCRLTRNRNEGACSRKREILEMRTCYGCCGAVKAERHFV